MKKKGGRGKAEGGAFLQNACRLRSAAVVWLPVIVVLTAASCRPVQQPDIVAESLPIITTETGFEMVLIPAGRFQMGNRRGQPDEGPVHEVSIDSFLMDRYEVTQEHWDKIVLGNPSHFKGPTRPVEMISWAEAALFCNQRSRAEGLEPCYDEATAECNFDADGYRLPTEAEWEYACRARAEADYYFGADPNRLKQYAWHKANASKTTHPVGRKKPNAWGLFDMHGNVAEWCNDVYDENYYQTSPRENPCGPAEGEKYVLRGGAWNCSPQACRSSYRVGEDPGFQDACFAQDAIGFRCVRKAPQEPPAEEDPADEESVEEAAAEKPAGEESVEEKPIQEVPSEEIGGGNQASKTGFVYGRIYLKHNTGQGHPERPQRLEAVVQRLQEENLLDQLIRIEPAPAPKQWLTTVHTPEYVDRVEKSCRAGIRYLDSMDTPVSERSYEAAVAAVGGVLAAIDAVMEGKITNAFCAVRPPGHHALKDRAMGFCLLNNVAIAARYVQKKHHLAKVLIVDWDVHHGNGTQAIFYDDPTVFYFSVHQYPFYPGTGGADERGEGKGLNFTLNVPLPAGSGDEQFQKAFEETLMPAALGFQPDFVLVSAGFDAHEDDVLGQMNVTRDGFAELTRLVRQIADQCCQGRLVSILEGGYDLEGLAASTEAHLRVLIE